MRLAVIAGQVFGGRMWIGRRDSRSRRDRLPMLRENWPFGRGVAPFVPHPEKRNRGGAIHGKDGRTFQPMASDWTDDRHVRPELEQTLQNLSNVLAGAGVTREQVIKVNVYLADLADWSALNGPYAEFFGSWLPARTAFATSALPLGARVEIEAWAVVEETR